MTSTVSPTAYLTTTNTTSNPTSITMEKSTTSTTTGNTDKEDNTHVTKLRENDVLLGRGGGTNNHAGNVKFRKLVNEHKLRYLAASKVDKPKVAREVVQLWRQMVPPGRFLARTDEDKKEKASDENTIWYDVGDKKANAKASQCLRERTPEVMPYLRQLREQQDYSTEQGVMMVRQQQQQQQQQQAAAGGGGPPGMSSSMGHAPPAYGADPYGGGVPQAAMSAYPPMMGQQVPTAAYPGVPPPHSMSPHHVRQHLPHPHPHATGAPNMTSPHGPPRRTMPGAAPYSPAAQGGAGGIMPPYNPMAPGVSPLGPGGSNHRRPGMPGISPAGHASAGAGTSAPPPYGYPPAPHLADDGMGGVSSGGGSAMVDPMDPSVAAYYGDMTDLEYEQSMMIMQQQLEMQQMQLRRMQQQRAMQRAALQQQQQQGGNGPSPPGSSHRSTYEDHVSMNNNSGSNHGPRPGGLTRKAGNFPQGPTTTGYGGGVTAGGTTTAAPPAPHNTRLPNQPPIKMTPPGSTTNNAHREAPMDANARKPKRTLSMTRPERTHSGLLHMNAPDLPSTAEQQDGELTLEEYRQQLEAYISNSNKNEDGMLPHLHTAQQAHMDDGDASDLEDDWEKERDKYNDNHVTATGSPMQRTRGGVARTRSRGVDRAKSGASFMSIATNKSSGGNMSVVSGFSNLSDLMSAGVESADVNHEQDKPAPKNRGVDRNQSNLSIMSELTDLSANIDNLSLYED